ncbi:lipid-transfer protein [Dactylosporangium sp. CA-092794]|uniref:lipid-transfer protein n=1 Tax=Dactylosporangium sp. CA-092794 TaxID=3239929 RepID=UPI003D919EEC
MSYAGTTAIAGVGATEFSKNSGRTEFRLALEAITAALDDAGLAPADVDGLVTFSADASPEIAVARALGFRELTYFDRIDYGGGAGCGCVQHAAMAVAEGVAEVVVCYRAFNERSGYRFGSGARPLLPNQQGIDDSLHRTFGLATAASFIGVVATRYMHEYGATSADFGQVSVACRAHAATNPAAWFYQRPITLADHQASPFIVEPLRLLDCCQETDGGVAIVVTSLRRARSLRRPPAVIAAAAQAIGANHQNMTSFYDRDLAAGLPGGDLIAKQLWKTSGLTPADIQTAVIYDHFTPFVLMQLEDLGFCPRGEARDFVAGGNIQLGGGLPLNTHGGQLGEAYLHGMNGINEAVRQVRGSAVNQVADVTNVLVTSGSGPPTSGLILRRDG